MTPHNPEDTLRIIANKSNLSSIGFRTIQLTKKPLGSNLPKQNKAVLKLYQPSLFTGLIKGSSDGFSPFIRGI